MSQRTLIVRPAVVSASTVACTPLTEASSQINDAQDRLDSLKDATDELVIDVDGLGMTGYEAEAVLRHRFGVGPEMSDLVGLVFLDEAACFFDMDDRQKLVGQLKLPGAKGISFAARLEDDIALVLLEYTGPDGDAAVSVPSWEVGAAGS